MFGYNIYKLLYFGQTQSFYTLYYFDHNISIYFISHFWFTYFTPLAKTIVLNYVFLWPEHYILQPFGQNQYYHTFIPFAEVTFTLYSFVRSHVYTSFLWPKSRLHFIPLAEVSFTLHSFGRSRFYTLFIWPYSFYTHYTAFASKTTWGSNTWDTRILYNTLVRCRCFWTKLTVQAWHTCWDKMFSWNQKQPVLVMM